MERGENATTRRDVCAALVLAPGAVCLVAWGAVVHGTFQDDDLVGPLGVAGAWRLRPFLRLTFWVQEALHGHRADLLLTGNLMLLGLTAIGVFALAKGPRP